MDMTRTTIAMRDGKSVIVPDVALDARDARLSKAGHVPAFLEFKVRVYR